MTFSSADWLRILSALGVRATTAAEWAAPFADEVQPEKFSAGIEDLKSFVPQYLYETALLEKLDESLVYHAERICQVWPSRFPTPASAAPYAFNPARLANCVYANRMGNGNEASGDGYRYRGRPMITGLYAYQKVGERIGQDLLDLPELIQQPHYGLIAMRAWWEGDIPDAVLGDQVQIRRRVQGSTEGLQHCIVLHDKLAEVIA